MENFKIDNKDGYSIISMTADRLDLQTTAELRSELVLLAGNQVSNMIIDLSNCNYCDTTGLSAIMIAHRLWKNGSLVLVGVREGVQSILSIQNFDPKLNIEPDVATAESFISDVLAGK